MTDLEFHPEDYLRRRPAPVRPRIGRDDLEFHPEEFVRGRKPRQRRRGGWDLDELQSPWMALGLGALAGAAALYYFAPDVIPGRRQPRPDPRPDTARFRDSAPRIARRESHPRYALTGRTVTINRPRAEIYAFWRDPANLSFMENIERVEKIGGDDGRLRWTIDAPGGQTVTLETETTEDRPNERIAWASVAGSQIEARGHVEFRDAPGDRGTEVSAVIEYVPSGGQLGQLVAKLFQREPNVQVRRDLKRLKMQLETGEIATSQMRKAE